MSERRIVLSNNDYAAINPEALAWSATINREVSMDQPGRVPTPDRATIAIQPVTASGGIEAKVDVERAMEAGIPLIDVVNFTPVAIKSRA